MQPLATHVLRRAAPPPAAASTMPPPPASRSPSNRAPLLLRPRPPELPLPSALVPPKKRRVFRTPPKATTPLPLAPPVVPVAVPALTPPPQVDRAESPPFSAPKPSPPPPAKKPSSPPPTPFAEEPSSPPPTPFAEEPSSPPPFAEEPSSPPPPPPPPPPTGNPSFPSPPPPSAADEKPSVRPPTDAAADVEPAPAPKARKIIRKVRIAATKAAAESASAAAGASQSQPGKGHAPEFSQNAAADEAVEKKQSSGGNTIEKPAASSKHVPVCETQLGKVAAAVCEIQLGTGPVGGGTLTSEPATDIGGEHEVKKLGSRGEDRAEVVMPERQTRMMTEVFVGGLNRDAKEEDVRAALSVAGEITEVRMVMATATKNKGFCFVRYRESAQARKAIAKFSNVKICGKQCRVAALDGNDKIFLGNIDKKWKKEDIMKLLQRIGVENIDVVTLPGDYNNPGYNRGFAFLELETYRDTLIAYRKLSRKDVFGKDLNIRVDWAEPLNAPDEKQIQKVNIRVPLAKSVEKGMMNMEDHKFYISEKDKAMTVKSERKLPSSSRAVPITGDKSSDYGFVQVLKELAPWRQEHTSSGSLTRNYPRLLSGEKRPFSALGIDSYYMGRNPHGGHERNTYATSTSSYIGPPPAITRYSPPYHHESRRCLLDSDSVLSEPLGGIQMRQACSRKSGMSHDSWH